MKRNAFIKQCTRQTIALFKTFLVKTFFFKKRTTVHYNITKAKRALWLVNLASTICPWVYAADVCANVYNANLLTDIVSKVMADVLLREMRNCLHSCVKMKLYRVTGVLSVVVNEFSRACFLLSCKTTRTFFLWCSSIKGLLLFQCLNVML